MSKLKKVLEYLLYLFVFLLPWQARIIYQEHFIKGQVFEYGRLSIYATELLLGLILILGIIYLVKKIKTDKPKISFQKSKARMLALLIGLILLAANILLATSSELSLYKATHLILAFCFFFILLTVKPNFKKLSWSFIYSALLQSIWALQQFTAQKVVENKWLGMASQDPNILGTPVVLTNTGRWLRSFGSLPHPNILAGFLVVALILILFLSLKEEIKTNKRNLTLAFVIVFLGLLTTLSKAAILSAIIVFVLALFITRRDNETNKRLSRLAIISLAIFVFFSASYPALVFNRLTNANMIEQKSYSERASQYGEWGQVMKSNLFFGVGLGNYPLYLQKIKPNLESWDYQPIHNTFLLIVAEIGLIPLAYLIGLVAFFIKKPKWSLTLYCLPVLSMLFLMLFDHFWWSFFSGMMLVGFISAIALLNDDRSK